MQCIGLPWTEKKRLICFPYCIPSAHDSWTSAFANQYLKKKKREKSQSINPSPIFSFLLSHYRRTEVISKDANNAEDHKTTARTSDASLKHKFSVAVYNALPVALHYCSNQNTSYLLMLCTSRRIFVVFLLKSLTEHCSAVEHKISTKTEITQHKSNLANNLQ